MADLIAIGYPDETTALSAMDEAERLQKELVIQADAVAAIIRNKDGKIRTVTNHHMVGAGATWGMFWGMLFGMLFFVPFLGMAVGAGMGALMGKVTKNAVDKQFQDQVREIAGKWRFGALRAWKRPGAGPGLTCGLGWSPPPESNRRPHPYHRYAGGSRRRATLHVAIQPCW